MIIAGRNFASFINDRRYGIKIRWLKSFVDDSLPQKKIKTPRIKHGPEKNEDLRKQISFFQDFPHFQVSIVVSFLGDVIEISGFGG